MIVRETYDSDIGNLLMELSVLSLLQLCALPNAMELRRGATDELTTLPKRAMCLVEIILT